MVVNTTPPAIHLEFRPEIGPAFSLNRRLTQEILATGECPEQLVVQVVAVGEDDDGGVLHRRLADDAAGVESHRQALAGALGVPDNTDASVPRSSSRLVAGDVSAEVLPDQIRQSQTRSAKGLIDGNIDGMELVIAGHLLGKFAAVGILENDEVLNQVQKPALVEHPLDQNLEFRRVGIGQGLAGNGAPGFEPFASRQSECRFVLPRRRRSRAVR